MKKEVYSLAHGIVTVDISIDTYNGFSIEQIKSMPFAGWNSFDKSQYIANCERVIDIQMSGVNLHEIESIKKFKLLFNTIK